MKQSKPDKKLKKKIVPFNGHSKMKREIPFVCYKKRVFLFKLKNYLKIFRYLKCINSVYQQG